MNKKTKLLPRKEFARLMRMIREQARSYPQEALEEIFLYMDWIERKHGIEDSDAR